MNNIRQFLKNWREKKKKKKQQRQITIQWITCFNDFIYFGFTDSFNLQKLFPRRIYNRLNCAETSIFKLFYVKGSNSWLLELEIKCQFAIENFIP